MKTYLVTGGAGFIGSNYIRHLLIGNQDVEVVNLDLLTYAGSLSNLKQLPDPDRHTFIEGDVCDSGILSGIFEEHGVDVVVHFAAESHVDRSILGPEAFIRTNIHGTFQLLETSKNAWDRGRNEYRAGVRFHHISTDEVYGTLEPDDPPFNEQTPYAPSSPYAASKAASDHLVRSYFHTYGLPVTITNCSNNYGPHQFPEKLIPVIILNARAGKPLPVYGDGKQIRDWLFVEDHCRAIQQVIDTSNTGETYNISGNNQPTNLEIVHHICSILDQKFPDSPHVPHADLIVHVKDRPSHDRRYAMNIQKIEHNLGWKPAVSLQEGLQKTVDWYLANEEWIENIKEQQEYRSWMDTNYKNREKK